MSQSKWYRERNKAIFELSEMGVSHEYIAEKYRLCAESIRQIVCKYRGGDE